MGMELQREITDFLKEWGAKNIRLVAGGKHPRLYYNWKGEEKFTVFPGSASDTRALGNQIADLKRQLGEPIPKPTLQKRTLDTMLPKATSSTPRHFTPFINAPGEFKMVPLDKLHVDPQYQRDLMPKTVERIARNWSWPACGVLLVSERANGMYYAFDGQHRFEAARLSKNSDWGTPIDALPCLVFAALPFKDEAKAFLGANTERRPMYIAQQFKALVIVGDPVAKKAQELVSVAKRTVSQASGPKTISCVSRIIRCLRADEQALRRVWPLCCKLMEGRGFHERLMTAIFELERRMPEGHSLAETRIQDRLVNIGPDIILRNVQDVMAIEGNRGTRAAAMGVLRAYNKGHKSPLRIDVSA